MAKVTLNVNSDKLRQVIMRHIELLDDNATMTEIHQLLATMCDPYVPYRTGALANNIDITADHVRYNQPYAARNYFKDNFQHSPEVHPLATAHWGEAMLADHGDEFRAGVAEIINRRLKKGG